MTADENPRRVKCPVCNGRFNWSPHDPETGVTLDVLIWCDNCTDGYVTPPSPVKEVDEDAG